MKTKKEMMEAVVESLFDPSELKDGYDYCFYYKAVLDKFQQLIEEYDTGHYISLDTILMDNDLLGWVLIDYDSMHQNLEYFMRNECDLYLKEFHRDYVIEVWDLDRNATKQQKIEYRLRLFKESLEGYKKVLINNAMSDYEHLKIEDQVYFLFLLEDYQIEPTEELYKKFCNSQEAFKREIELTTLLAV